MKKKKIPTRHSISKAEAIVFAKSQLKMKIKEEEEEEEE